MDNTNNNQQTPSKPYNLDPNIESALAYLIPPFTGVLVLIFEKENKFVRFHAMQSVVTGLAFYLASILSGMLIVALIGVLLAPLVSLAAIVLWVVLIYKAYNNEEWEIPILGKLARDFLAKIDNR